MEYDVIGGIELRRVLSSNSLDVKKFGRFKMLLMQLHLKEALSLGLNDNYSADYTMDKATRHVSNPNHNSFIITYKGVDCGIVEYRLIDSEVDNESVIYLSNIFIAEEFRRKGIAKCVINMVRELLPSLRLELVCWYGMEANRLYKSMGMKEVKTMYTL